MDFLRFLRSSSWEPPRGCWAGILVQPVDSPQKPATLIPQYQPLLPKKSRSSRQQEFPMVANVPSKFKESNGEEYAIMLAEKLPLIEETPQENLPVADRSERDPQEKRRRNSNPNHPMRRATDFIKPNPGSVLAQAASSSTAPDDEISTEHQLAATLPVDQSVVTADGRMDSHRTPIVSVHGKDIDEHELGKSVA